jgi:predicted regulator of Ras-like GTPase activity (Roadblock/LC7/MglB family)
MDYLAHLNDLQGSSADVEGALLVSMDGKLMASSVQTDPLDKADNAAKHCAEAVTLALDLVSLTARGNLDQIYIKAQHGYVIVMPVGTTALLVVLARAQAKLGLIFLDIGRAVKGLGGDIDGPFLNEPIFPWRPPKRGSGYARPS